MSVSIPRTRVTTKCRRCTWEHELMFDTIHRENSVLYDARLREYTRIWTCPFCGEVQDTTITEQELIKYEH